MVKYNKEVIIIKHLGTKKLETERLILRKFTEEDAEGIFNSYINDELFLYYANKEPRTLEDEKKSLIGISKKYDNTEYYNWLITLKNDIIIGAINLNIDNYNESVEFNYAISEKYYNKGYMTEALLEIKRFCLEEMHVNRFSGGCEKNNLSSKKVMEKCGIKYEGTLRNYLKLRDGYHDMLIYSYINEIDNKKS